MVAFEREDFYTWDHLLAIMRHLRSPEGCPWDQEQTHTSIRQNMLEEAYEVCEAIDLQDACALREELGDVLLQVVFHAQMEREAGGFSIEDVIDGLCKKLIERHPHVFATQKDMTAGQVLTAWEEIKQASKGNTAPSDAMDSVSRALPALMRAVKLQKKAGKVGFDFPQVEDVWDKLQEECQELHDAVETNGDVEAELGDLLFSVCNLSRFYHVDPELALERTCARFIERFRYIEQAAPAKGRELQTLSLAEMDKLWDEKKRLDRQKVNN